MNRLQPISRPRRGFTLPRSCGRPSAVTLPKPRGRFGAFTLVEMLVVIGVVLILMVLLAPAFTSLKSGGDVTGAAYTIKGALEQARTYAMSNNTYTWVGFYEEATTATSPTNSNPPYPGTGRVLVAAVYSIDGTQIFDNTATSAALPAAQIKPLGKLTKVENIHLTDIGAPPSPTPFPTPLPNTLNARSGLPYTENASLIPPQDHYNRISSDSSDKTKFWFVTQNYTFYKTVRFSPRGEAKINSTYELRHVAEIGIRPSHATTVDNNTPNVIAIQFAGFGGNMTIYRR